MTELTWAMVMFAGLLAVYTLGWIAGHEHCSRWSQKETLDNNDEFENLKEKHDG